MTRFPIVFISHGSPMLAIRDSAARRFLMEYGKTLGRPRDIMMISAHWLTDAPTVGMARRPETIHDFGGFDPELYRLRYPAPGAGDLAETTVSALEDAGFAPRTDRVRGLDHGAWVPLLLLWPAADIPVAQLSVQPHLGPEHAYRLGETLGALRDRGTLIIGSGALTHNLMETFARTPDAQVPGWVSAFSDWMSERIATKATDDLLHYRERAPFAVRNHPTDEHLLPLFHVLGAARATGARNWDPVHRSYDHGVLAMDMFAFD